MDFFSVISCSVCIFPISLHLITSTDELSGDKWILTSSWPYDVASQKSFEFGWRLYRLDKPKKEKLLFWVFSIFTKTKKRKRKQRRNMSISISKEQTDKRWFFRFFVFLEIGDDSRKEKKNVFCGCLLDEIRNENLRMKSLIDVNRQEKKHRQRGKTDQRSFWPSPLRNSSTFQPVYSH